MRILYVCPCWPGIEEAYNEGVEPNGMPGFFYVLRELIECGNEVDLFIYTNRKVRFQTNHIQDSHWFSKVTIADTMVLPRYSNLRRILYEIGLPFQMNRRVSTLMRNRKYDFVYGQGNYANCTHSVARKYGVPFGLRKYGDDFAPLLKQKGILQASLRSPLAAYSYLSSKAFMLGTNDGTQIGEIARRFRKNPPYEIYVWNNGFYSDVEEDDTYEMECHESFLFQFSRFVSVKGQIDTVEAFYRAKQRGYPGHLIFGGTPDDPVYYKLVNEKIDSYDLRKYTHFLGKLTAGQTKYLSRRSLANIISGVNYNMNNVFIETLGYGGIALVRNTPLVDQIIRHGVNGFLFTDLDDCAAVIMDLYNGKYDVPKIRKKAVDTCLTEFGSWKDRVEREVDLIARTIANSK